METASEELRLDTQHDFRVSGNLLGTVSHYLPPYTSRLEVRRNLCNLSSLECMHLLALIGCQQLVKS